MIIATPGLREVVQLLALILSTGTFTACNTPTSVLPKPDGDAGGLILPEGFTALVVTDSIGPARHLAVKSNGDIYVKLRYSSHQEGGNVAIRDNDGDGKADVIKYFGDYLDHGTLANGMAIHGDYLYYSSALEVFRQKLDASLVPNTPVERILVDDHTHGTHWHITKPMAFDQLGNMYIPFGAPSNACMDIEETPAGIPGLPGKDPCPELEKHGGIWKFRADQQHQTQADGSLFASGIRSVVAMRWNHQDDHLYAVMHGRDDLNMLFPNLFSTWHSAVLPAEEFMRISEGDHYGWPYCYYDQLQAKKVLAPEYGGDGKEVGRCAHYQLPLMGFPGHWAPNDLYFYQGSQFPPRYRNGAFIAFHGSTNRTPYPQAGYFVAFIPFSENGLTDEWEVFADGFAQVEPIESVSNARYRPMGLTEGPDGSLYISESRKGKIWRIMYPGDPDEFEEKQLFHMEQRKQLSHLRQPHPVDDNLQKNTVSRPESLYISYCQSCHQADGNGAASRFPPLAGSEWVTGDKSELLQVVVNGIQGEIEVNGIPYNGVMPAFDFLNPEELALLLTYVRQKFGKMSDSLSTNEVNQWLKTQS